MTAAITRATQTRVLACSKQKVGMLFFLSVDVGVHADARLLAGSVLTANWRI